jgi:hypothetical protein
MKYGLINEKVLNLKNWQIYQPANLEDQTREKILLGLPLILDNVMVISFKTFPMLVIDNIFADCQPGRSFLET